MQGLALLPVAKSSFNKEASLLADPVSLFLVLSSASFCLPHPPTPNTLSPTLES